MGWWRLGPGGGIGIPGVDAVEGMYGGDGPADEMGFVHTVLSVLLENKPKPTIADLLDWLVRRTRVSAAIRELDPDVRECLAGRVRNNINRLYEEEFDRSVELAELEGVVQFVFGGCDAEDFWVITPAAPAQVQHFLSTLEDEYD